MSWNANQNEDAGWRNDVSRCHDVNSTGQAQVREQRGGGDGGFGNSGIELSSSIATELTNILS